MQIKEVIQPTQVRVVLEAPVSDFLFAGSLLNHKHRKEVMQKIRGAGDPKGVINEVISLTFDDTAYAKQVFMTVPRLVECRSASRPDVTHIVSMFGEYATSCTCENYVHGKTLACKHMKEVERKMWGDFSAVCAKKNT